MQEKNEGEMAEGEEGILGGKKHDPLKLESKCFSLGLTILLCKITDWKTSVDFSISINNRVFRLLGKLLITFPPGFRSSHYF